MSNVEHSLNILLPTYNNVLPPDLLDLATALLAQSRSRAANLKPEEEIARPYVCAEIACKRLKSKLRLPPLQSRPPCPPRVYKKLSTFLEQALPSKVPKRPAAAQEEDTPKSQNTPKKARLTGSTTTTPTKAKAAASSTAATPATTPRKKVLFAGAIAEKRRNGSGSNDEAPAHIQPLLRRLCTAFSTPQIFPHVYTAFCTILPLTDLVTATTATESRKLASDQNDEDFRSNTSALTIAIYFMVLAKMQKGILDAETHLSRTEQAIKVADEGGDKINSVIIDEWLATIRDKELAEGMEWWDNVPEDVIAEGELGTNTTGGVSSAPEDTGGGPDEQDDETAGIGLGSQRKKIAIEEDEDLDGVLLPGLGTMMQERVDWLSEDRRLDFVEWKEGIMERVKEMEKGKGKGRAVAVR